MRHLSTLCLGNARLPDDEVPLKVYRAVGWTHFYLSTAVANGV